MENQPSLKDYLNGLVSSNRDYLKCLYTKIDYLKTIKVSRVCQSIFSIKDLIMPHLSQELKLWIV